MNNNKHSSTKANLPSPKLSRKQKKHKYLLEQLQYSHKGFSHAYKSESECSKRTKHAKKILDRAGMRSKTEHIKGIKTTITISEEENQNFTSYLNRKMDKNGTCR